MRKRKEHERLALALGFTVKLGNKHGKVYDGERLVAVYPLGKGARGRRNSHQLDNFRAALLRAARERS